MNPFLRGVPARSFLFLQSGAREQAAIPPACQHASAFSFQREWACTPRLRSVTQNRRSFRRSTKPCARCRSICAHDTALARCSSRQRAGGPDGLLTHTSDAGFSLFLEPDVATNPAAIHLAGGIKSKSHGDFRRAPHRSTLPHLDRSVVGLNLTKPFASSPKASAVAATPVAASSGNPEDFGNWRASKTSGPLSQEA